MGKTILTQSYVDFLNIFLEHDNTVSIGIFAVCAVVNSFARRT